MTREEIILLTSIGIASLILLFVIIYLVLKKPKRKKKRKSLINQEFIGKIVEDLGGKENIKSIDVIETKLKIMVNDLKIVKLDELKEQTTSGVFVSGNTIKILFKYDSKELKDELNRYKGV